jgi:thioredoxin-related protein
VCTRANAAELWMFESRGCPWCTLWHREVGPGYPKSSEGKRAPLQRIDLSDAASVSAKLARPITASPTFVLIDDGREVGRITGYPGADFFWGMLAELIAKLDSKTESFEQRAVSQTLLSERLSELRKATK